MAEWWENKNTVRGLAATMAAEFKRANVGCCDDQTASSSGHRRSQEEFNREQEQATERLGIFGKVLRGVSNAGKTLQDVFTVVLGDVVRRGAEDFSAAMEQGVEANKAWRTQMYAIKLGDTASNIANLSAETRQSVLAMGGFEKWVDRINNVNEEYFGYIGNTADTTRFLAKQMQLLGEYGVKPSLDAMKDQSVIAGGTNRTLKDTTSLLVKLGVPVKRQQEMLRTLLEDENIQNKLRGKNTTEERLSVIRNLMARQAEYQALGLSTEQAMKASKALEQIGGKKPVDRIKMAAKATAALSAMGIEGAARVGDIIRMGQRATKDDQEWARKRLGMAEDVYAESKQLGMGYEMTISALYEKGGLADLLGEGGVFSTKLKQNIQVVDKVTDSYNVLGDQADKFSKTLVHGMMLSQEAINFLNRTVPGLLTQKGPLGAGALTAIEGAVRMAGAQGIMTEKEGKELIAAVKEGGTEFAKSLGLDNMAEKIVDNPMVQGIGNIKDSVVDWYHDWKKTIFGDEKEDNQKKIEELQKQNADSLDKISKLVAQQNQHFSKLTQYTIDAEANKISSRKKQLDALEGIKSHTKPKAQFGGLRGNAD